MRLKALLAECTAGSFGARLGGRAGVFASLLAGLSLPLGGCGDDGVISRFMLKPDRIIVERRPDPVYDQFFSYYAELCATSQFRSKLKGEGGIAGHAVMYVKGACKDEQAEFPRLRRCRVVATDLHDPEHGATIEVEDAVADDGQVEVAEADHGGRV